MAYWNITLNPAINQDDLEVIKLLTKIETFCDILKSIPIGQGLRNEFVKVNKRPSDFSPGTLKEDIVLRDIKGTAAIEGNTLNTQEINDVIYNDNPQNTQEQEIINLNSVRIYLERVESKNFDGIITEELLQKINQMILKDIVEDGKTFDGSYRNYNVIVGKNHRPPEFEIVPQKMKEFIKFINSEYALNLHPMIRAMLAHFYLVSIHPFGNGNGRTSRAIESFLFYYYGYSVHGFHSLNNYYYKNYAEYFSILDHSRFKYSGCLQEFIKFGLKGYLSELQPIKDSVILFTQKKGYQNYVKELYEYGRITARQYGLIEYFMTSGKVLKESFILEKNEPILEAFYQKIKSKKTIQRDLDRLKEEELITINTDKEIYINYNLMEQFTN